MWRVVLFLVHLQLRLSDALKLLSDACFRMYNSDFRFFVCSILVDFASQAFCTKSVCSIWSRFVTKVIFGSMLRVFSDRGSIQKQAGYPRCAFTFCGWISCRLDTHVDKLAGQYFYAVLQVRYISILCLFYSTCWRKT